MSLNYFIIFAWLWWIYCNIVFFCKQMLIDIERYLIPDETDTQLLQLYLRHLLDGSVRQSWSPILYLIGVHHTNRFLYYTHDTMHCDLRHRFWGQVLLCQDEVRDIFFCCFDFQSGILNDLFILQLSAVLILISGLLIYSFLPYWYSLVWHGNWMTSLFWYSLVTSLF